MDKFVHGETSLWRETYGAKRAFVDIPRHSIRKMNNYIPSSQPAPSAATKRTAGNVHMSMKPNQTPRKKRVMKKSNVHGNVHMSTRLVIQGPWVNGTRWSFVCGD